MVDEYVRSHLHGHKFSIIARIEDVTQPDNTTTLAADTSNPMKRDTIEIPSGGSVKIRWVAENPGAWFFHCHIEYVVILILLSDEGWFLAECVLVGIYQPVWQLYSSLIQWRSRLYLNHRSISSTLVLSRIYRLVGMRLDMIVLMILRG